MQENYDNPDGEPKLVRLGISQPKNTKDLWVRAQDVLEILETTGEKDAHNIIYQLLSQYQLSVTSPELIDKERFIMLPNKTYRPPSDGESQ